LLGYFDSWPNGFSLFPTDVFSCRGPWSVGLRDRFCWVILTLGRMGWKTFFLVICVEKWWQELRRIILKIIF
jgi:hypothetical protein